MRFSVLGPLVVRNSDSVVEVTRPKERRLLALLISRAGQRVAMSEIVHELWADDVPTTASRTVQSHIVRLRKLVPEIETSVDGYLLRADSETIDASRFEELVRLGRAGLRAGDAEAAAVCLADAERLWRGPAYEEFAATGVGFAADEGARLDRLRVAALEDRWDAALRVGDHREAVAALERLVTDEPLRERLWGLLMLALYRCDRQADALAAYRRAARTLAEELGIDPSPTLRQLHADILAQDAGLRGSADADPTLLLAQTLQILAADESGDGVAGPCPWLGLRSYGVADQAMFVGRERMVADLVARLAEPAVVTMLGSSGIGKSSLVRAGVVPALAGWRTVVITPGEHPTLVIDDAEAFVGNSGGEPAVVVIDQAEELFAAPDLPVQRLLALCDVPNIRLVLVVRADMAAVLTAEPQIAQRLRDTVFMVGPMTPAELTRVVMVPAARAGRHVEPVLLGQILADLQGREAMLPLLATALEATWRAEEGPVLTLDTYRAVGGIGASLERSAEDLLRRLDPAGQEAVRRILLRLADSSVGQPVIRRRAPIAEIAPPDDPVAAEAFARLVERRLVATSVSGVEVTHEILFTAWPRLRAWLDEDVHGRHIVRELAAATAAWATDRDESGLYRGARLHVALDWSAAHAGQLTAVETAFLAESERAEQRDLLVVRQRSRRLARAVLALVVALAVAVSATILALVRTSQAQASATTAEAQRLGALGLTRDRIDEAMLLAVGGVRLRDSSETRGDLLATLLRAPDLLRVARRPSRILGLAAAAAGGFVASGERDGHLALLDGATLHVLGEPLPLGTNVLGVCLAPDGKTLAAVVADSTGSAITFIDVASRRMVAKIPGDFVGSADCSRDGRWVAAGLSQGGAVVVRMDRDNPERVLSIGGQSPWTVPVFAGPGRLVVAEGSGTVGVWDIAAGRRLGGFSAEPLASAAASPDGTTLVLGGSDGSLSSWSIDSSGAVSGPLARIAAHTESIGAVAFSPDGSRVASAGDDGRVRIWDAQLGAITTEVGDSGRVTALSWSTDGQTVYSAGLDGAVMAWDEGGHRSLGRTLEPPIGAPALARGLAVSPLTRQAITAIDGGAVVFRTPDHPGPNTVLGTPLVTDYFIPPAFSADGRLAFTANEGSGLFVWDAGTRKLLHQYPVPGLISSIATDASEVAVALDTGRVVFVNATTGAIAAQQLVDESTWPTSMQRSPDGHTFAVAGDNGVTLFDVASGRPQRVLTASGARILAIAYSPDGSRIVGGGEDGVIRMWATSDGHLIAAVPASSGLVVGIAYAPGAGLVASGGTDGTVRLFDAGTLAPVGRPLPGPDTWAFPAFLDDRTLLAGFADGSMRSYDVAVGAWIDRACAIAGRELTAAEAAQVLPGRQPPMWCA